MSDVAMALQALRGSSIVIGVGAIVSTTELVWLRSECKAGGYFDWRVVRLQNLPRALRWLVAESDWAMPVFMLRLLASVALIFTAMNGLFILAGFAAVALAGLSLLTIFRLGFGTDGSDQMEFVAAAAIGLGFTWPSPNAALLSTVFLACQSMLAYSTSGMAKLFGQRWRSGKAIQGVLTSRTYGRPRLYNVLKYDRVSLAIAWGVMGLQIIAPLAAILPFSLACILLGALLCFHVGTAAIMGLNTFAFSFAAPVPAVLFLNGLLHSFR